MKPSAQKNEEEEFMILDFGHGFRIHSSIIKEKEKDTYQYKLNILLVFLFPLVELEKMNGEEKSLKMYFDLLSSAATATVASLC